MRAASCWPEVPNDILVHTTGETTVKARDIRRDARVSVCADNEEPPFALALIFRAVDFLLLVFGSLFGPATLPVGVVS